MKICIINTGGTISSVGTPLAPMSAVRFADAAQQILAPAIAAALPYVDLHFDTRLRFSDQGAGTLDSTDLQPVDWCRIAGSVLDAYADHDAFVILHGTDTMDFSAAALSMLLNVVDGLGIGRAVLSKPVILTGAQLPLFRETEGGLVLNAGSDAFANLCGALTAATLRLPEVALFFDGKLLRGNRALKVSTTRFAAFDSPHLPPLAEIGIGARIGVVTALPGPAAPHLALDDPQAMRLVRDQLAAVSAAIDARPVVQLPAFPARIGQSPVARMIADAVGAGAKGIVLEAYGEGNFPSGDPGGQLQAGTVSGALMAATAAGVIVVDTSRVIGGQVDSLHYAAGAWIARAGAIGALDMTPVAALAKVMILLALADHYGWDMGTLRALIQRNLAGECRSSDRLDSVANPQLLPGQVLTAADGSGRLINDPQTGLALQDALGRVLWTPAPSGQPGRLRLDAAGRLTLTGHDGRVLWRTDRRDGPDDCDRAMLLLRAGPDGRPILELHDLRNRIATLL